MPIHTLISTNDYKITVDSGIDIDPDTSLATRRISAVFRGSLQNLYSKFQFGTQDYVPESQTRLYCSGPRNVQLIDGTDSNPHWSFDLEYVGLHSYIHGSASSVFRVTPLWSVRELQFPFSITLGGTPYDVDGNNFKPTGASDEQLVTVHDYLPGFQVRGIMCTNIIPHPAHPYITALRAQLGTIITPSMLSQNMIPALSTPVAFNYAKGIPASGGSVSTSGLWFIGDIQADRLYEPMDGLASTKIYQVQFPVRWLSRSTIK